jgi:RimJ/RimL family protein N-acetyltransferase
MTSLSKIEKLKNTLASLKGVVAIDSLDVEENIIRRVSIVTSSLGTVNACRTDANDAQELFEFYMEGLSEKPRQLFAPYPLFHTPPGSAGEMARRIEEWKKETDWAAINLFKDKRVIGFGLLKRFRSEQVTSAIAIRDEFLQKGLGYLLQMIIVEQGRLLNLPRFHVKVVSDNYASVRLHEKCGFRETRKLPPELYAEMFKYLNVWDKRNGLEAKTRHLIEMVIDFN